MNHLCEQTICVYTPWVTLTLVFFSKCNITKHVQLNLTEGIITKHVQLNLTEGIITLTRCQYQWTQNGVVSFIVCWVAVNKEVSNVYVHTGHCLFFTQVKTWLCSWYNVAATNLLSGNHISSGQLLSIAYSTRLCPGMDWSVIS